MTKKFWLPSVEFSLANNKNSYLSGLETNFFGHLSGGLTGCKIF